MVYVPNAPAAESGPKFSAPVFVAEFVNEYDPVKPGMDRPRTLRAEQGVERLYPLSYRSSGWPRWTPWPRVTGKALARALADELSHSGLFSSVRAVDALSGLPEEALVIQVAIRDAALRVRGNEPGTYSLALELTAYNRSPDNIYSPGREFWRKTLSRSAEYRGRHPAYDLNDMLRPLYAEALKQIAPAYEAERAREEAQRLLR